MKNHSTQGRTSKYTLLLILVILVSLSMLTFTACDNKADIASISVIEESIPQDKRVSEFDITQVVLEIEDSEGNKSTINATPLMLTTDSRNRLTQGGEQKITLRYQQKSTTFTVNLFADDAELVTVTFKDHQGIVIDTMVTEKGGQIEPPQLPAREGYIADGWIENESNQKISSGAAITVEQSIEVIASYEENIPVYTVTFKDYKENTISSIEVPEGNKIPSFPGYEQPEEVASWNWVYGNSAIENIVVTANIEISMEVEYVKHLVTYNFIDKNGITVYLYEEEVRHGSSVKGTNDAISELQSKGYNFLGWDRSLNNVRSDLTVTANAEIFSYRLEFSSNNRTDYITVNHGDDATPPQAATKTGYLFDHWEGGSLDDITQEMTFTAVYNPRSYTITLRDGGASENKTMYFDDVITADNLNGLKDKGEEYILLGIYSDAALTQPIELPYTITGGATFHTKWININEGNAELEYSNLIEDSYKRLIGYTGNDSIIYIPDTDEGMPVTMIDSDVFMGKNIMQVNFGENILQIGDNAFADTSLEGTLTLPQGLEGIGQSAFSGCSDIETIVIPESVQTIGLGAFEDCSNLSSVVFEGESALIEIGDSVFKGCISLETISLPSTITTIGQSAFENSGLTEIDLTGVTDVGVNAFAGSALGSVIKTDNLSAIGESAFENTELLSISLPAVTSLGEYAFANNKILNSVTLGASLSELLVHTFMNCSSLTNITFQTQTVEEEVIGIEKINDYAFMNCNNLISINLPQTLRSITGLAFDGANKLTEIIVDDANTELQSIDGVLFIKINWIKEGNKALLCYPAGKVTQTYTIPTEEINVIMPYAFKDAKVANIIVPALNIFSSDVFDSKAISTIRFLGDVPPMILRDGIMFNEALEKLYVEQEYLANYLDEPGFEKAEAYMETSQLGEYDEASGLIYIVKDQTVRIVAADPSLQEITVPANIDQKAVTHINDYAFENCDALESIHIDAILVELGEYAFKGCYSLEDIDFAAIQRASEDTEATIINFNAFEDTPWYKESDLVVIADTAFEYKYVLDNEGELIEKTSLEIPYGVEVLKENLFNNVEGQMLESITLPQTLEVIGAEAFKNTNISQITIPASVYSIGSGAFENCLNLAEVNILTNSLTEIKATTFKGCQSLSEITIPNSIRIIGDEAFMDCVALEKVNISSSASLTKIGASAFKNCSSLPVMTISANVGSGLSAGEIAIGDEAFMGCDSLVYIRIWSFTPATIGLNVFEEISVLYVENSEGEAIKLDYMDKWSDYISQIEEQSDSPQIEFVTNLDAEGNVVAELDHINIEDQKTAVLYSAPALPSVEGYIFVCWTVSDGSNWVPVEYPFYTQTSATLRARWVATNKGSLSNDDLEYNSAMNGYILRTYTGTQTIVVIPEYYGEYPIIAIDVEAFEGRADITEIIFDTNSQITLIRNNAFANMTNLKSINLPSFVIDIEDGAFRNCVSLEEIIIPNKVQYIGEFAFEGCTNLDIIFQAQSELKYSYVNSFEDTKWYTEQIANASSFVIAGSLLIEYAPEEQQNLVTLPIEVKAIKEEVFMNNTDIVTIEISSNVEFIGPRAFYNCSSLINVDFGTAELSNINYVGEDAFANTPWLSLQEQFIIVGTVLIEYVGTQTQINLPYYITVIDEGAFSYSSVEQITLSSDLKKINKRAFYNCFNLTSVTIPENVVYIGEEAFRNNTSLKTVKFEGDVEEIGDKAFMGCTELGSDVNNLVLTLPASLEKLGEQAFEGCNSLTRVDMQNTQITELKARTFYGATSLNLIKLSSTIEIIDDNVFTNCSVLENIELASNSALMDIADKALIDTAWYNRAVPEGEEDMLIYLGNVLLKYRQKATSDAKLDVTIPSNIKYIAPMAFHGSNIASVVLPDGLLEISDYAFSGCLYLNNVVIPNNVWRIGERAFQGCSILDNIELGTGLEIIEANAFENSSQLSKITVNKFSYGELTIDQEREIEDAIDGGTLSDWLGENDIFIGTELANPNAFNNTSEFLRIYVVSDSKNMNIEIYKTMWDGMSGNLYNIGDLPTVEFTTVGNASPILPISAELLQEEDIQTVYKDHTLLGWEMDDEEGEMITFPLKVTRDMALNPIWISNNRPINDPDLGLNYDAYNSGYVIYAFDPSSMLVENTLVIASKVSNLPLIGINAGVFNETNTANITKVMFTLKDNLSVMENNMFKNFANLEEFIINGDKSNYVVIDGVLYTADQKTLVAYPRARKVDGEIATSFEIPSTVTTILADAFWGSSLESVSIPASVKFVGDGAFNNNASLEEIIFDENSEFEEVAYGAFDTSAWYQNITSPFQVAGSYLLSYYGYQSSVTVPDSVKVIGERAFENNGMDNITELVISQNVVRINESAFLNCSEIESIIFQGDSQLMYVANDVFYDTSWIDQMNVEANEFIIAGNVLIKHNGSRTSLTLPTAVKVIGYEAFSNATFTNITLHDDLQRIDEKAFFGANNLASIMIPASVTSIGDDAFFSNISMTEVIFADGSQLNTIGDNAFANSFSLESIQIPDGVTTIGEGAFEYCMELETVEISLESQLVEIGERAFKDSDVVEIYIPNGLREIKASTFENCSSLTTVTFSEDNRRLTRIGQNAFRECISLGSDLEGKDDLLTVQLPDNVYVIESGAFYGCSSMYGIILQQQIKTIEQDAFRNCSALANITILTAKPPQIDASSFHYNEHSNVRVYVNTSSGQTILNEYRDMWGSEIVAKTNFIQERGFNNYPLVEIYDMDGQEEVFIESFRAEFLKSSDLPPKSDPIKGMSTGYRKDSPTGPEICTQSDPYEIIRAEVIKLYIIWSN